MVEQPEPLLRVSGIDLLDGTPVLDIKPYLPYADALADATGGFAPDAPSAGLSVGFSKQAEGDLAKLPRPGEMRALIIEVLSLDPRPAYRRGPEPGRIYGVQLAGLNIRWQIDGAGAEVVDIKPVAPG